MNARRHIRFALATVLLASGCAASYDASEDVDTTADALSASASDQTGDLGQGFDSLHKRIRAPYCLMTENVREVGYQASGVRMTLQSDRTQIARSLGVTTEVSYGIASAAAEFVRESQSDERTVTYVFGSTMTLKDRQLGPNPELTSVASSATDPLTFYDRCGDQYVQKVSRGSSLYTMLKFRFASRTDKESFEAKMSIQGGLSASATLEAAAKTATENVSVQLSAVQVGGDVTQLPTAAKGNAALCALGDIKECLGFLNGLEGYGRAAFPQQFAGKTGAALDAMTATIDYKTAPWFELGVPNAPAPGSLNPSAYAAFDGYRTESGKMALMDAIESIGTLPNRTAAMVSKQSAQIARDRLVAQGNEFAFGNAFRACYPMATSACASASASAKAGYKAINEEALTPWFDAFYDVEGKVVDARDLVDVRGDGHKDYCRHTLVGSNAVLACQRAVGQGFEAERRGFVFAGRVNGPWVYKAWIWADVQGNGHPAYCVVIDPSTPTTMCALNDGRAVTGVVRLTRGAGGVTMTSDGGSTAGIDPAKAYGQLSASFVTRYGDRVWPGR
jgi:hypothetical protein